MGNKDLKDPKVLLDPVVCPVHQEHLVAPLSVENKVSRDHLVSQDHLDLLDSLVCVGRMVNLDSVESLD